MTLADAAYRRSARLGECVSLALRHALFEEGHDIGSAEVIADIAGANDLEPPDGVDGAVIVADLEEGRRRGVEGSPHYFVGDVGFFCPALEIAKVGDHLRITSDPVAFESFLSQAFPTA